MEFEGHDDHRLADGGGCDAIPLFAIQEALFCEATPLLWTVAVGVAAASLFSLVQMENWLWSFQFAFFFIQFTVIASLIILCRTELALWLRILAVAPLGAAASFSSAQGLLLWPALIFSLCLTDDPFRKKAIGLFCLLISAAVTFALYFSGLPRTTELHLRPEQIIEKVQLPFFGFLGLVGNPLAHWISYEHLPHRAWFIGLFDNHHFPFSDRDGDQASSTSGCGAMVGVRRLRLFFLPGHYLRKTWHGLHRRFSGQPLYYARHSPSHRHPSINSDRHWLRRTGPATYTAGESAAARFGRLLRRSLLSARY